MSGPQCPVCYERHQTRRTLLIPECGHTLCIACCRRWMTINPSCPLCRTPTLVMSRDTRFKDSSRATIDAFWAALKSAVRSPNGCTMLAIRSVIEELYFGQEHVWSRIDMKNERRKLYRVTELILGVLPSNQHTLLLEATLERVIDSLQRR